MPCVEKHVVFICDLNLREIYVNLPRTIPPLEQEQFSTICELLKRLSGIALRPGKEALVQARLSGRLQALGLNSFNGYIEYLHRDTSGAELRLMVDILTTNKTSFFRESEHFDYLATSIFPAFRDTRTPLRVWSAGCSCGAEPYSIAIALCESLPDRVQQDCRILATDISTQALAIAREGTYPKEILAQTPVEMIDKYFSVIDRDQSVLYRVNTQLKSLVWFAHLNLIAPWPMRGPFDVIFCRNVMIYFDQKTVESLVNKLWGLLPLGGYLFIGHTENLIHTSHKFRYVQPAIYQRIS